MKHEELWSDKDRGDLARSTQMAKDAKKLRRQVFARVRARAFRKGRKDET